MQVSINEPRPTRVEPSVYQAVPREIAAVNISECIKDDVCPGVTVVDFGTDPVSFVDPAGARFAAFGTKGIDTRSQLLEAGEALRRGTLDPYLFMRDGYLQRREALVRDGRPAPIASELDVAERGTDR
jgi:ABC-type transporter lipoprotein component MlaA